MKNNNIQSKNKQFAFVVDGECEYWYIKMFGRNEKEINVTLNPEIPQKKKLSEQYKKVIELSKNHDKVFWIIDFDTIHKETKEAKTGTKTALQKFREYYIKIAKYENVKIIINNPCLEYWYLLHFETTSKYFATYDKLLPSLKKHIPNYEKTQQFYTKQNNDIYLRHKPHLLNAIKNANKLQEFDFENPQRGLSQMQFFFETDEIKKII
ncbi:hypothetical protein FACS189421_04930 [Bacteroidia bacterium]|nr:hypothetical protein FACS189421_04930 [Bacteroidia bacterium]GHT02882.1 hypothetical protein FACS189423_02500 [Bacteroidia bacterium]